MSGEQSKEVLEGVARQKLLGDLHQKYESGGVVQRSLLWRKKYSWLVVVKGTAFVKRLIDILASLLIFILLCPLMAIVALAIKFHDGGPVFYVNDRVGRWGRTFRFPKFRSMVVSAHDLRNELSEDNDHGESVTFKMRQDPRVTPIGRWIRRLSLDELPQLWCVLKGDMSLVGPRPPLPEEVALYGVGERRRLDVKPGITCFWQVEGRSEIPFEGQLALDLQYIQSQSVWEDMRILLRTIPAVLLGRGAY